MNQEIIEKYLQLPDKLNNYQLKAMIQEIADARPTREYKLWMQIKDAI